MSEHATAPPAAPETTPDPPPPVRRRFVARNLWQTIGPFAVFVVFFVIIGILQPDFVGGGGLGILTLQATSILLVALGQAMVLHVGSIDLSNAALAIFAAILLALMLGPLAITAPVLCLVAVTLVGAVNGIARRLHTGALVRAHAGHAGHRAGGVAGHQRGDHRVRHRQLGPARAALRHRVRRSACGVLARGDPRRPALGAAAPHRRRAGA